MENSKMNLQTQLKTYGENYIKFMGLDSFPKYSLVTREASIAVSDKQGYDIAAATFYNLDTHSHTLKVSTNLPLEEHLIFHELTHILDSEMYVNGDKTRYAGLSGFTEYHASQVELMRLLDTHSVDEKVSFTMNRKINTVSGCKTISQYVSERYHHAIDLFERADFPANIATLKTAVGVLCNYYGLRSICEMYATDYVEEIDNQAFLKYIPTLYFTTLNNLMHGWLDLNQINNSIAVYIGIVFPIIQDYKLQ